MQIIIAILGLCGLGMLFWYFYILLKGDEQA